MKYTSIISKDDVLYLMPSGRMLAKCDQFHRFRVLGKLQARKANMRVLKIIKGTK